MGIVSEYGVLTWGSANKKYYMDKGYIFTHIGDSFKVKITDLSLNSQAIVDVQCDFCNAIIHKTYKDYNALRGNKYCCPDCLKHKKKCRDENGNLTFVEIPYRNKEWLYNEYIVKNRFAQDIADECGINIRTLREWINIFNLNIKYNAFEIISRDMLMELYSNQHLTTLEIGDMFGLSDGTILKLLKDYQINIPTRSELMRIYYEEKGGYEIARKKYGSMENRIKISCRQRDIDVEDFTDFKYSEDSRIRNSSEYKEWRNNVFSRDDYTCQKCGKKGGNLNAHHIYNYSQFPNLRFDINNGITLCEDCHLIGRNNSFHTIYGEHDNNKEQIEEFLEKKISQIKIEKEISYGEK